MRKPTPEFEPAAFTNEELRNLLKWILRATTDTLHLMEKHDEQLGDVVDDSYVDEEGNRQACEPVTISAARRHAYRDQVITPKWMAKDQCEDRSTLTGMIKLLRKREGVKIGEEGKVKIVLRDIDFFTFYETVVSYLAKVQDGTFEPKSAALKIAKSAKEYQKDARPDISTIEDIATKLTLHLTNSAIRGNYDLSSAGIESVVACKLWRHPYRQEKPLSETRIQRIISWANRQYKEEFAHQKGSSGTRQRTVSSAAMNLAPGWLRRRFIMPVLDGHSALKRTLELGFELPPSVVDGIERAVAPVIDETLADSLVGALKAGDKEAAAMYNAEIKRRKLTFSNFVNWKRRYFDRVTESEEARDAFSIWYRITAEKNGRTNE